MSVLWTPLRLVMEEQERKEEAAKERWREGGECRPDGATLPIRRQRFPPLQNRITTTAVLEGARDIGSGDGPKLNGLLPSSGDGDHRQCDNKNGPDDKPSKLVVNLKQLDKASQIPEIFPLPESDIELKKIDEPDGEPEQEPENSCVVDCLYVTLQCCDCSLM